MMAIYHVPVEVSLLMKLRKRKAMAELNSHLDLSLNRFIRDKLLKINEDFSQKDLKKMVWRHLDHLCTWKRSYQGEKVKRVVVRFNLDYFPRVKLFLREQNIPVVNFLRVLFVAIVELEV